MNTQHTPIGLYIHIPFCKRKCPYCDFYSINQDESLMDSYVAKICSEIRKLSNTYKITVDTLYLGGGTPGILGTKRITKLIFSAQECFNLKNAEITIELNPTQKDALSFKELLSSGINRLSFGVQSFNDIELRQLGRTHDAKTAINAIKQAQHDGFENISIDLMLATPLQTLSSLTNSIETCKNLNIQHISTYLLKIEPGTLFFKNQKSLKLPDEDLEKDMYLLTCEKLEKFGFRQYEISNFAIPGYQSRHNKKYWNCCEYIGLGPSAHSFFNGRRSYFERNIENFIKQPKIIDDGLGADEEEYVMLQLRLVSGVTPEKYYCKFGKSIPHTYIENAKKLPYVDTSNGIRLTREGFLVSNTLIGKILDTNNTSQY